MLQFDYLKTAIKQKGCTLQQVADASGMTKGYLSQLLNDKIKSPSAQKLEALHRYLELEFPRREKKSAWCLVNFTHCIPAISISFSVLVVRSTNCTLSFVTMSHAIWSCLRTVQCHSNRPSATACAGYYKPLSIRKTFIFIHLMKMVLNPIHMAGMSGAVGSKSS